MVRTRSERETTGVPTPPPWSGSLRRSRTKTRAFRPGQERQPCPPLARVSLLAFAPDLQSRASPAVSKPRQRARPARLVPFVVGHPGTLAIVWLARPARPFFDRSQCFCHARFPSTHNHASLHPWLGKEAPLCQRWACHGRKRLARDCARGRFTAMIGLRPFPASCASWLHAPPSEMAGFFVPQT